MKDRLTIGIAGAGGDGVVVLGSVLQRLAASQGYFGQMSRYYGPQIRGGASGVKLGLGMSQGSVPGDTLDIMILFNWEKYLELEQELPMNGNSVVFYDGAPPKGNIPLPEKSFQIGFSVVSKELTGATLGKNFVALGLLERILALPENLVKTAKGRDGALALLEKNKLAFSAGKQLLLELPFSELRLSPPRDASVKHILHGNAAIAQGAMRAGCRAFFGYPITPAAEIMQEMQEHLGEGKGVFLQAEDEIASMGLALGASIAGAKSMTATSGPGFDLMTEMIGLASSAEIPVVIVDVQRCGPSTGIPSKSEQSDLNQAIYGGHGDAPRVVIVPYNLEGCYRLTIESFNISEYFQVPVIILSDQWLAQTTVATNADFLTEDYSLIARKRARGEYSEQYQRYELTEDFISPMASAGDEGLAYQTTGLTHSEQGRPSSDYETHQQIHEKRWKKLMPLWRRDDLVRVFGREEARKGIVVYGSSAQFVLETVEDLNLEGEVKVCVPELVYPLPDRLASFVHSLDKLLVVEMSYSAQFYHYLRSQIDLPSRTEVCARAGGLAFSRRELSGPITALVK
jgi:2-oxoglutarate/2-oxoacid ferredoxin oxidoreductase subunit alpha